MNSAQYPCFRDCQTSSWPVMSKFSSNELIVSIIKQRRKNSCLNMNLEHLFDIIFFSCLRKYVCLPRIVKKSSSIIFKICIYFHSWENKEIIGNFHFLVANKPKNLRNIFQTFKTFFFHPDWNFKNEIII